MLVAVLLAIPGVPAWSADPDLPAPDPPYHWRYITQDPATTSSDCIGDPKTPVCALDTAMAFFTSWNNSLCETVSLDMGYALKRSNSEFSRYRIAASRRLTATSNPPHLYGVGRMEWKPGDIEVIIRDASCDDGRCSEWLSRLKFVLRRTGDRWVIVDKGTRRRQ